MKGVGMNRVLGRAVVTTLLLLSLVAPSTAQAGGETVKIKMKDAGTRRFAPASVTIARGTKVKWVNAGSLTHTTTANGGAWDETLDPGEKFVRKFRRAGTFAFHCSIHPSMTGTVTVT